MSARPPRSPVLAALVTALLVTACSARLESAPPTSGTAAPPTRTTTSEGTSASPATTSSTPTPTAAAEIRLLFTGDMLPSDALQEQAARYADGSGFDFMPMLAEVAPMIEAADWAVCHQETPVSDNNEGLSGWPQFNAPYELAEAQAAVGFDACSTASNHSVDLGEGGVIATLNTLDRVGIEHAGTARTAAEEAAPTIYDVRGVRVGHLSYTYALNGLPLPQPWMVDLIDPELIRADAAAISQAGADIVVVSLHFGDELIQEPSAYQEQVVTEVMQSPDVDLIVGHHAHVVQPIEQLPDGRWVIYGLGNFLAQQAVYADDPTPPHRDGLMVEVTFGAGADGAYTATEVGYLPIFVDAPADVIRLAPDFSRERTEAAVRSRDAPLTDLTPSG
ncbi:CapA family protein [soil metagenome]